MKNLKRFLTVVFSLALTLSLWFTGATLAKTAKAEGAKTYDISEVYTDMAAGGELSMVLKTVYGGNAVNYGDAVEFEYKMNTDIMPVPLSASVLTVYFSIAVPTP